MRRLYAGYTDSATPTAGAAGALEPFRAPSAPIQTWRASAHAGVQDFTLEPDGAGGTRIRVDLADGPAADPVWIAVDATCNVVRANDDPGYCPVRVAWKLNGAVAGPTRTFDAQYPTIVSGSGELLVRHGDVLQPCIAVDDADMQVVLTSCTFSLREDP